MEEKARVTVIERKKLVDALQILRDNIPPSDLSDASTYLIIQNNRFHAFNDSIGITIPMGADLPNCAVELQLLYDFLRKMKDKEVRVGMNKGNFKIVGKNSTAEFPVRSDMTYPDALIELDQSKFTELPATFALALTFVGFTCDKEQTGYERVAIRDGYAYGLSAQRCARFFMGEDAKALFPKVTFVSPDCLTFVNKLNPKKYYVADSWIHLYTDDMVIYSSRTRADDRFYFDMVEELLEESTEEAFRLPPNFDTVLDRATPFSGKTAQVRKVALDMRDGRIDLVAIREDGSSYKERCIGTPLKNPKNFTVSLRLLNDVVKLADTYQLVETRLIASTKFWRTMIMLEVV